MLQPVMHILAKKRIVLASGSPRRKTILSNVGLQFDVIPSTFEENLDKSQFEYPYQYVIETAKLKALEVAKKLRETQAVPADIVVGCDTVVTMDGKINEKPRDKQHAFEMLTSFNGRNHTVVTGVVIITNDLKHSTSVRDGDVNITTFYQCTDVKFASISEDIITAYIDTGEPMDKAGGYGIQAIGGSLIESIQGDYFNVMGFPLHGFSKLLYEMITDQVKSKTNAT